MKYNPRRGLELANTPQSSDAGRFYRAIAWAACDVEKILSEQIGSENPYSNFKPCIVVTNAREALEAAWELAYEPEDGVIPAWSECILREREGGKLSQSRPARPTSAKDPSAERRILDAPKPEPEPWELSTFCYATGDIYRRVHLHGDTFWLRTGESIAYHREDLAKLNPQPVTIE